MNVLYALRRAVRLHGGRHAFIDGERKVTWREFSAAAHRGASFLRAQGIGRGDRVAVLMANRPEYLELYFATALAGIVIVPLNTRWNITDVLYSIQDSGARALIVDHRFAHVGQESGLTCPVLAYEPAGDGPLESFPEPDPEDLVGLYYTSGTTGGPKGVMLTHRNLFTHMMVCLAHQLAGREVFLHAAPMFHLADLSLLYAVTNQGGTHCFVELFDPAAVLAAIERYRVERVVLVPTMINMVVNHPAFDAHDLSSLKHVLYGASPMPVPLLELAMRKFRCRFTQAFGMTEMSPIVTVLDHEDHRLENLDARFTPVKSGGKPVIGVEVRVVDELDRDLPVGEVGEIIARGETRMKGYWKRAEVNDEVMRGGWMHTGDLGAFDANGFLYILDRKKDMIKTGGENVYSPEVESMVMSHPAVLEASMIGIPHEKWGESIRAVVSLRPGSQVSEADLIAWCRERLTHFKCPTSIVFVDSLPKGGSGKVQKNILRKEYGA